MVDSEDENLPALRAHAYLSRARFVALCDAVAHDHLDHPGRPWLKPEVLLAVMASDAEAELVGADRRGPDLTTWWRIRTIDGQERWAALCVTTGLLRGQGLGGFIQD